jgi:hypothetical protein
MFAFVHREIYNDDAWIGQQVHSLLTRGYVVSDLFRDCPPLDERIVVYHKLLVWVGVAVTKLAGWGLYQLRAIPVAAGMLTMLLVYFGRIDNDSRQVRLLAVVILMFTPLVWKQMLEFRPEMLVNLCGFASFLLLWRARERGGLILVALSGALAGLAGLAHAFGMVYAVAGFAALSSEKRFKEAAVLVGFALLFFFPYASGYFTDRELFLQQTVHNNLTIMNYSFTWWQPLVNLVEEHKRWLRKPEVIGITVWFIISLFMTRKDQWRRHRFFWVYTIALALAIAVSPLPKFTRYMLPLIPFLALAIARTWDHLPSVSGTRSAIARSASLVWIVVFYAYGIGSLSSGAFLQRGHQVETNRIMSEQMNRGAVVIAPFDFVFEEIDHFDIRCWWGAERGTGKPKTVALLEDYAVGLGAEYLIFDPLEFRQWNITPTDLERQFKKYRPLLLLPDRERYLLARNPVDTAL